MTIWEVPFLRKQYTITLWWLTGKCYSLYQIPKIPTIISTYPYVYQKSKSKDLIEANLGHCHILLKLKQSFIDAKSICEFTGLACLWFHRVYVCLLSVGWWPLSNVCCLMSAVCCLLSVVCCLLSVVCCLLSVACCLLSVVCCLLSVVYCLLSVVCCLLTVVCCLLSVVYCLLSFVCCLFSMVCGRLSVVYGLLSVVKAPNRNCCISCVVDLW